MAERSFGEEIRRDALLARLERGRPSVAVFVAPAGFGKTTLVKQFLRSRGAHATCDCTGVQDELDVARRLIPALAAEDPQRMQRLTRRELMLGDSGTSIADRVRIALDAWSAPVSMPATFVFENAEHLMSAPGTRDLFARLMVHRPAGRTVVVCSRQTLRPHLTRFVPPHEIVVFRPNDLAFTMTEIQDIFGDDVEDATVERIHTVTQGWPIAVFLVKRFAAEGRLERLLAQLDDVAFEELHDYLVDEVLAMLDARTIEALFAAACIPQATPLDIAVALDDPAMARDILVFAKESPFVARQPDGSLAVHPLLASLLLEHRENKRDALLFAMAQRCSNQSAYVRAAALHIARGDHAAAAGCLSRCEAILDRSPSMEYARILATLEHALVAQYPRLWGVTALLRIFCSDAAEMLDEAEALWRTLPSDTPPAERFSIFLFRVLFMGYLGMTEEAGALVEAFARASGVPERPASAFDGAVFYLRALVTARLGRLGDAERDLMLALPRVQGMDAIASGSLLALGADIARVRGERVLERQLIDRALEHARRSFLSNFVAFDLAEGVIGAWIAGEGELMDRYGAELEEYVERMSVKGFAYLSAVARGRESEPTSVDLLKYVAFGRMIAAANATSPQEAERYARGALDAAAQYRAPFAECLAAVATAQIDRPHFGALMQRAAQAARTCESPALEASVASIAAGRPAGMLGHVVAAFSRERYALVEIGLLTGSVRRGATPVQLSGRELELLIALAVRRETVPRSRLTELLWPELEEYAARNALSVCLHRLRAHLGDESIVVRDEDGYRLHEAARVDLWEIETILADIRPVGNSERQVLREAYRRLCARRSIRMQAWVWFEPVERHIGDMRLRVAMMLAADALDRRDAAAALQLAEEMIAFDACDEPAREVAIRAHLLAGNHSGALRHLRQYQRTLQAELQCDASPALIALVGTPA